VYKRGEWVLACDGSWRASVIMLAWFDKMPRSATDMPARYSLTVSDRPGPALWRTFESPLVQLLQ
jgi:hypothetical protein